MLGPPFLKAMVGEERNLIDDPDLLLSNEERRLRGAGRGFHACCFALEDDRRPDRAEGKNYQRGHADGDNLAVADVVAAVFVAVAVLLSVGVAHGCLYRR